MARIPARVLQTQGVVVTNLIDKEGIRNNDNHVDEDSDALRVVNGEEEPLDSMSTIDNLVLDGPVNQPSKDVGETGVDSPEREGDDFRICAEGEDIEGSISRSFGESEVMSSDRKLDEGDSSDFLVSGVKTLEQLAVSGVNRDTVQCFASSVVAVFPSVSELVVGNPNTFSKESVPAVSLRLSFLLTRSGDQLLALFDEIMGSGKFLADAMVDDWNALVNVYVGRNDSETTPLYLLLLWRLQLAAVRSYIGSSTHVALDSNLAKPPSDEALTTANSDADSLVGVRTIHDFAESSRNKTEIQSLVNLLPSIFERCLSLNDSDISETMWDLGILLAESLKHTSLTSALRTINDYTGRRIHSLSRPIADAVAVDEAGEIEPSIGAAATSTLDDDETRKRPEEGLESITATLDVSTTKNSKRRKKRKVRSLLSVCNRIDVSHATLHSPCVLLQSRRRKDVPSPFKRVLKLLKNKALEAVTF
jgi:hypothetical protein